MIQSVITADTAVAVIASASEVISRELTDFEKTLVEYALDQVRLGLVD